jgi:transglutaminase-like putative cysteine protease
MSTGQRPEGAIDADQVEWDRVAGLSLLVVQRFRYDYREPIRDLRHRLMVVPPDVHGGQRVVVGQVRASAPAQARRWTDEHGNVCLEFAVPAVASRVEFAARIVVRRQAGQPTPVGADRLYDARLLEPTPLTAPTGRLARVAAGLRRGGRGGLELALAANRWVHGALRFAHGATGVGTTAAQALALGRGVCQDHAHVMLSLCRLLGLPARYVSGHVLGEGGTHAWVEVLVPDPDGSGGAAAVALDPTYGSRAGLGHLTVATGRDYADVAPTCGTFLGTCPGRLTATKRVDVLRVEYAAGLRRSA